MPAVSQQQQKIMGIALSVKRGETPESEVSDDVLKIVNSMSQSELEKYAGTEHDGLPQKVEQKLRETIREIIAMNETEYVESKHAPGPYVGFVEVGNGRKKKIREFDTGRGAQVWLTKNAQKFFDKGFKRVGTTRKSDWDNDPFVIKESVNESNISESYRVVAKNKSGEVFKSGIFDKKKATDLYYKMAKSKKYTSIDIVKESVNEAELPKNGSTIKVSNIPVKIEYVSGGKYIGYSWKDKNNKEHYEETKVSNHTDLNSLIKTITAEIRYQRIHKNESVNEGRFDKDIDKIQSAVENASSFMNIGSELKKLGIKYDFSTGMMPIYTIKISGNTVGIVNKRYTDGAEREVGDVAIGLLENIRVNESSKPKVVTKKEWDRLHSDFKSIRNGQAYMMYMDKVSGATIYGPVTIKESVKESVSVFDERHFGKRGIIIMIDDNGKKVSAIFKDKKNADKYNRNKPEDVKKLLDLARKTPYPKAIDESVKEAKMSDALLVADQLVNGVDEGHLDKREFISHLSKETKFGKNELGKVFDAWVKMNFREKDDLGFSNKEMLKWLKKFGINESITESDYQMQSKVIDSFIDDLSKVRGISGAGASDWGTDNVVNISIELGGTKNAFHNKHGAMYDTFIFDLRNTKRLISALTKKHNLELGKIYIPAKLHWQDKFSGKRSGYEHNRISFQVEL